MKECEMGEVDDDDIQLFQALPSYVCWDKREGEDFKRLK